MYRVTDVRHDSRQRASRGLVRGTGAGTHFDGARFSTEAVRRGAVAVLAETSAPICRPSPSRSIRVDDVRLALAHRRRSGARPSDAQARPRRHHRHERQNDDRVAHGASHRRRGRRLRTPRDARLHVPRRHRRRVAHDARSGRLVAVRRARPRARRDAPRDGGVEHRAHASSRRRRDVRRRRVHEPDPRSPRLSRHDGRVRRRQSAPLLRFRSSVGDSERRRSIRRGAGRVRRRGSCTHGEPRRRLRTSTRSRRASTRPAFTRRFGFRPAK